jgi:hypothetical protein
MIIYCCFVPSDVHRVDYGQVGIRSASGYSILFYHRQISRSTFYPLAITHPGRLPPFHLLFLEPRLVLLFRRCHPAHCPTLQLLPRPLYFLPSLWFSQNRSQNLRLFSSGDIIQLRLLQFKLLRLGKPLGAGKAKGGGGGKKKNTYSAFRRRL